MGGDRNTFERGHQAALSFVDVDQVGDDSYERLSAHCEAVLKFVRILLEAFRLPRLIPRWPQQLTSVGLQALRPVPFDLTCCH